MSLTNYLLLIIASMLFYRFYPAEARVLSLFLIGGSVLYGVYWLIVRFPDEHKRRKAQRAQEAQDEAEFWKWRSEHGAIRAKYDPENKWNEATSLPREYEEELWQSNLKHQAMLQRRNGYTLDVDGRIL
jgi:hypothetical protein